MSSMPMREWLERAHTREQAALLRFVLGGLAHDLGTPLNVMQGVSQLLLAGGPPPKVGERLESTLRQVTTMTDMLRETVNGCEQLAAEVQTGPLLEQLTAAGELHPGLRWRQPDEPNLRAYRGLTPDLFLVITRWLDHAPALRAVQLELVHVERPQERRCAPGWYLHLREESSNGGTPPTETFEPVWRPPRRPGLPHFSLSAARLAAVTAQAGGYVTCAEGDVPAVWFPVTTGS